MPGLALMSYKGPVYSKQCCSGTSTTATSSSSGLSILSICPSVYEDTACNKSVWTYNCFKKQNLFRLSLWLRSLGWSIHSRINVQWGSVESGSISLLKRQKFHDIHDLFRKKYVLTCNYRSCRLISRFMKSLARKRHHQQLYYIWILMTSCRRLMKFNNMNALKLWYY